jgi:hypothetical protein
LLVLAVAVAVETTQPPPPDGVRIDDRPIVASLTAWDGTYYVGIAEDGYHADPAYGPDYAFYPGYPVVVRAASLFTGGDVAVAAILVANVVYLLALVLLYALAVRHLDPGRAVLSLWFLSLAPGAVAYALSYSEGLFLLFAVGAFLAMETRHPWLAGTALALATVTRVPGILLGLPLLVMLIERDGLRPTRSWLPLFLAPLAVLALLGYLWWLTGDPTAPLTAQSYWSPSEASDAARSTAVATGHGNENFTMETSPEWVMALWVGTLMFYSFLLVFMRHDQMRPAYRLVAILGIVSIFLTGRLQSSTRYLAVAWPFDWTLASRRSRVVQSIVLAAFVVLHVAVLWLAFTWRLAP